jgi:outer membrane protein assembly factor BamB
MLKKQAILFTICILSLIHLAAAQDWPAWRGPNHNGSTTAENLPDTLDLEQTLKWKTQLPGDGPSTPIIKGQNLFLTAVDTDARLHAVCLNAESGEIKWDKIVGSTANNKRKQTKAAPSPVTDGQHVWFLFANGLLVCTDNEGNETWRLDIPREHGSFELIFDYGSSPLLLNGKLIIPVIHGNAKTTPNDKSYLLCLNAATGETAWKTKRVTPTTHESKQAYTTPYPMTINGQTSIIILGADHITAHDPENGDEIWRSENYNPSGNKANRVVPSPVSIGSTVIAPIPRVRGIVAVNTNALRDTEPQPFAWQLPNNGADVCSPLVANKSAYILDGRKRKLLFVNPENGTLISETTIENTRIFDASPVASDGKIFLLSKKGTALIYTADEKPRELSRLALNGNNCRSSIAIAHNKVYIRVNENLYCFAKRNPPDTPAE